MTTGASVSCTASLAAAAGEATRTVDAWSTRGTTPATNALGSFRAWFAPRSRRSGAAGLAGGTGLAGPARAATWTSSSLRSWRTWRSWGTLFASRARATSLTTWSRQSFGPSWSRGPCSGRTRPPTPTRRTRFAWKALGPNSARLPTRTTSQLQDTNFPVESRHGSSNPGVTTLETIDQLLVLLLKLSDNLLESILQTGTLLSAALACEARQAAARRSNRSGRSSGSESGRHHLLRGQLF
mmetsp:Transcript_15733/g.37182  ORF Transcript_15733/g.37182 Transcript_15733/m.37182 type:complete len:240 (+) Transcript_15733:1392-2111(+)